MEALLAELGNPERDFKVIHIAGTNGKGSTAVMISSILEEAGYSVGLFMSPHLEDECERVQIWDGVQRLIDKEELTILKEKVKSEGKNVKKTLHVAFERNVKNTLHKENRVSAGDKAENTDYVKKTLHASEEGNVKNTLRLKKDSDIKNSLRTDNSVAALNMAGDDTYVKNTLHSIEEVYGKLTVFEIYTGAAYLYFKEQAPDFIVLETGLGGRLDSTNTIERPLACVITQVGLDHTRELGRTVEQIAHEKAGIIKPGVPVVSESTDARAVKVLREEAEEKAAPFIDAAELAENYKGYELAMTGEHQIRNAAAAVEAIKAAGIEVSDEAIENGLAEAHLPGRIEILGEDPCWIIDGAHNPDAIEALINTYKEFENNILPRRVDVSSLEEVSNDDSGEEVSNDESVEESLNADSSSINVNPNAIRGSISYPLKRTLVIFGCMRDKNLSRMIQLLSEGLKGCEYASCAVDYSRAEDPALIAKMFEAAGASCTAYDSVRAAYEHAKNSGYDCILVTGSIYLAGEIRGLYMHDNRTTK